MLSSLLDVSVVLKILEQLLLDSESLEDTEVRQMHLHPQLFTANTQLITEPSLELLHVTFSLETQLAVHSLSVDLKSSRGLDRSQPRLKALDHSGNLVYLG